MFVSGWTFLWVSINQWFSTSAILKCMDFISQNSSMSIQLKNVEVEKHYINYSWTTPARSLVLRIDFRLWNVHLQFLLNELIITRKSIAKRERKKVIPQKRIWGREEERNEEWMCQHPEVMYFISKSIALFSTYLFFFIVILECSIKGISPHFKNVAFARGPPPHTQMQHSRDIGGISHNF